ncbi:MAG TPA: DUF3592 domain-containing protein [Thermoanaerobaculia bacterium]|nr:DUF3592 domain-containing protein [Thermoanaerobaculia bacterium]
MEFVVVAVVVAALFVPGALGLRRRVKRANDARAAGRAWPTVRGRIISSELSRGAGETGFRAAVWYEYIVDGRRFSSNVLDLGDEILRERNPGAILFTRFTASAALRRFSEGAEVTVHYDPADPTRSFLA